nr:hypothetical protein [Mycobacterium pseudoshottsii]
MRVSWDDGATSRADSWRAQSRNFSDRFAEFPPPAHVLRSGRVLRQTRCTNKK